MVATEADVHAATIGEVRIAALSDVVDDDGLLRLGESWARKGSDYELLQDGRRRFGLLVLIHSLLEGDHQGTDGAQSDVEEGATLMEHHTVHSEPWILVEGRDERLIDTNQAALSERGLLKVSGGRICGEFEGIRTRCGVSACLAMCTSSSSCRKPLKPALLTPV